METETKTRAQRRQAQRAEKRQASAPELEVARPNRTQRRNQLQQAQHGVGKVQAKMGRRDDRWMKRLKTRTKGISGNPQKRFVQLQSKIEIENAYRGHV